MGISGVHGSCSNSLALTFEICFSFVSIACVTWNLLQRFYAGDVYHRFTDLSQHHEAVI
jgi:hypothetical protein